MQVIINDDTEHPYNCVEGSVYTRNYNETLDSMEIRISHLENMLDIEPYDKVKIIGVSSDFYMCIDSWNCIEEGLDDPIYYTYEISLFSMVKKLENIILPNIAITPIIPPRTINYYLNQYITEYAPSNWQLSQEPEMAIFDVPCPEMQWNTPTLREVLNDLMMVVDCICTFNGANNEISFINLTIKGSPINTTNCNYIRRSMSSQDYVSEIRMNLQNAMEDYSSVRTEIIPFSSTGNYVLNGGNFCIKTMMPIKKINHLWMSFVDTKNDNYVRVRVDLINYLNGPLVLEKNAYKLLEVLYFNSWTGINIDNNIYKYQNFCLYYNRYGNTIEGLTDELSNLFAAGMTKIQAFYELFCNNILGYLPDIYNNVYFSSLFFEVEYETTADLVFSASKLYQPRNKRVIMDNQTNSFANTKKQAALEYQKVNRLGNEQLMINQRVSSFNDVITLAQTYEDSIVYQTQYQIYTDHIEVNALATKNYVLQNYFTGIKSHIRTWVNARDEAITRHELIKERYVFDYTYTSTPDYTDLFEVALKGGYGNKIKYVVFTPIGVTDAKNFTVDCIARVLDISMVFTFGCEDNAIVYTYYTDNITNSNITIDPTPKLKETYTTDYGGVPLKSYKYVDDNYENGGIKFSLSQGFISTSEELYILGINYEIYRLTENDAILSYMLNLYRRPMIQTVGSNPIVVNKHKDNKEISKYSYQIEFGVNDLENMYLSNLFAERQEWMNEGVIQTSTIYKASSLNNILPNNASLIFANINCALNSLDINFDEGDVKIGDYIYICDNNDSVILAFKVKSIRVVEGVGHVNLYLNKE